MKRIEQENKFLRETLAVMRSQAARNQAGRRAFLDMLDPSPAAGRTAGAAVRGAMGRGATHIRRLIRPGGSGLWLAEFETRPGCEPVRFGGPL